MIFDELYKKVNSVIDRMDEMMVEVMMENKEAIIDLNVSQLEEGINSEGGIVGEYESEDYAKMKQSIGSKAPIGIVDTKLEGDFHSGFFAEPYISENEGSSGLIIDSKDSKSKKLERKYPGLFGIAPQNTDLLIDIILDDIKNKIFNEITT